VTPRTSRGTLHVDAVLDAYVEHELLADSGIGVEQFWAGVEELVMVFAPQIRDALALRDRLQEQLDAWHRSHPGPVDDVDGYAAHLRDIGYLVPVPSPEEVRITTTDVDDEIARIAGPQLVVPVTNARFAANAANARWGSLYDALYGTDAIPTGGDLAPGDRYNPVRGAAVIRWARELLDTAAPLSSGSHADARGYAVDEGALVVDLPGGAAPLADPAQFVGYRGDSAQPSAVLLVNHGLHVEIQLDRSHPIGSTDLAGVSDVVLESAVSTIMDLEDAVSAVDAADKVVGYRNWQRLMTGTLEAEVQKAGRSVVRRLEADRAFVRPDGSAGSLPGRSLQFIRHVGHAMWTDAVTDAEGRPIPEGLLDAVVTVAGALPDIRAVNRVRNSRTGSMYIVKPKQHGPDEVALTVRLFAAVERMFGLPERTLKIGIMDEERRTTLNLAACVAAARDRVVFINTGFLDRTGDEIHSSSAAGSFLRKGDLRAHPFLGAYERNNVAVGLAAGFAGRAQIGKGMWAMTDQMGAMLDQKIAQPLAGASTAWVPSPTGATLHATHYHRVDVAAVQRGLGSGLVPDLAGLLDLPVLRGRVWTPEERREELDDNVQSILGYVVRWVDQGIGCSKVPNLADIALMEDRATLRISSQLLGNWLLRGVIDERDVLASLDRMAPRVDAQNAGDSAYRSIGSSATLTLAYLAARDLILLAPAQPNGYTEAILHDYRRRAKAAA
jgi:malate synthase